jgi:hypothetical protein
MKDYSKADNIHTYFKALVDAGIEKDLNGAVVTKYHQANSNILSLLQDADSEESMIKLIKDRMDPHNYRRRDPGAILSEGNIANAIKHLGDFENTVMSLEDVKSIPDTIFIDRTCCSSSKSAFEKMMADNKKKSSFASKCSGLKIKSIESVSDLYKYIIDNPKSHVSIKKKGLVPIYLAKTSIDPEKLCVPHMWAFARCISVKDGWCEVKCIVPMHKYISSHKNIAFILGSESVVDKSGITNCCFPSFLNTAYHVIRRSNA